MSAPITEEERRELKASFDLFDDSKTGNIMANHVGMVIRACGENPTEARINEIVRCANEKDGIVSFEEFLATIQDIRAKDKRLTQQDVENAFKVFDSANTGSIHADELRKVLTTLGEKLSEEEAEELLGMMETSSDGLIDYTNLAKKLIP